MQTMRFSQVDRPCPKCGKMQRAEEFETHLVCCLTKPALEVILSSCQPVYKKQAAGQVFNRSALNRDRFLWTGYFQGLVSGRNAELGSKTGNRI